MKAIRIKCTSNDPLRNVTYVYQRDGVWRCALSDGTPASFSYAGFRDEMSVRFALEDARTPAEALNVLRSMSPRYLSGPQKDAPTYLYEAIGGDANTRLIEQAPSMADMLNELHLCFGTAEMMASPWWREKRERISAILAKLEGQS